MKTLQFTTIEDLENLGVDIELEALNEETAPDFDDEEAIKEIERQYNNGNGYAWFCAHVTVKYRGLEADDYLGGCSYKSERDFKENSSYYIDMISQCVDQINIEIESNNKLICKAFKVRNLKRDAEALGFIVVPKTAIL